MAPFGGMPKPECDFAALEELFKKANADPSCNRIDRARDVVREFLQQYNCAVDQFTETSVAALQCAEVRTPSNQQGRGKTVLAVLHQLRSHDSE